MFRALALAAGIIAATEGAAAQSANVETDPIVCWWRTDASAGVRVGEPFTVVLTCSLLEAQAMRVVADESRLEPSVVQLAPFEVVGGARAKDLTTAGRRFLQYQYNVRFIGEHLFGRDTALPALQLSYRIESQVGTTASGTEAVQGRDLLYTLPPLPLRVLSLVPDNATDIQEAPVATLDQLEDRGFRSTLFRGLAAVLFLLGALAAMTFVIGLLRRRAATRDDGRALPDAAILHGVRRELMAIRQESQEAGWTPPLTGRALAALRIAAAYASGRPVNQSPAGPDSATIDGQIAMNGRLGRAALVSGAVTPEQVSAPFDEALARFTAARYGRDTEVDSERLTESLEHGLDAVEHLAAERPRPWTKTKTKTKLKRKGPWS